MESLPEHASSSSSLAFTSSFPTSHRLKSILLGLPWTIGCYIGFVEFVIFSSNILITHLASLLSNTIGAWDDLVPQILFFFVMIPILQVFFQFLTTIFANFFRQFSSLSSRGLHFSDALPARIVQLVLYSVLVFGMVGSVLLALVVFLRPALLSLRPVLSVSGLALAILCAVSPILAFLRVLCAGWCSLFGVRAPALPPSFAAPFDMAGLLSDATLPDFLNGLSSPLRAISRRRERWPPRYRCSLAASAACLAVFAAYVALDVRRELQRGAWEEQRGAAGTQAYQDINGFVCTRRCREACANRSDPACPANATEAATHAWCIRNCSCASPGCTLAFSSLRDGIGDGAIAVRFCFLALSLPLVLAFHPLVACFRAAELRESRLLAGVAAGVVFGALGAAMLIAGAAVGARVRPPAPLNLSAFPANPRPLTRANPALGCDFRVDALRLAMAPLGPESWRSVVAYLNASDPPPEEARSREIVAQYVTQARLQLLLTDDLYNVSLNDYGIYFAWSQPAYAILSFPSTGTRIDLAFVIENVATTWWNALLMYVVPFHSLIFDVFLNSFQTGITQSVVTTLFGPRRLTYSTWSEAMILTQAVCEAVEHPVSVFWVNRSDFPITPVKLVVGNGAYGLIAKAVAIERNISGVAFNAPVFDSSPVAAMTRWHDGTRRAAWDTSLTWKVWNVVPGSALQFSPETKWVTRTNWKWPQWKWPWETVGAAETLCAAVAGCATDDKLEDLCVRTIGKEAFDRLFDIWQRPRIDGEEAKDR